MLRRWLHANVLDITPNDKITDAKILQAGVWGLTVPNIDTTPDVPFIIIRAGAVDTRLGLAVAAQRFFVYIHDAPGSYVANIEPLLLLLGTELPKRAGVRYQGWSITACEYEGQSDDLTDQDKNTIMRYGQFRITGRPLGSA